MSTKTVESFGKCSDSASFPCHLFDCQINQISRSLCKAITRIGQILQTFYWLVTKLTSNSRTKFQLRFFSEKKPSRLPNHFYYTFHFFFSTCLHFFFLKSNSNHERREWFPVADCVYWKVSLLFSSRCYPEGTRNGLDSRSRVQAVLKRFVWFRILNLCLSAF